jgi:hypothetical protein
MAKVMTKAEHRQIDRYHNGDQTVVVGVRMTIEERDLLDEHIDNSSLVESRSQALRYSMEQTYFRKR